VRFSLENLNDTLRELIVTSFWGFRRLQESRSVNYPADGFEWLVIEVWNCAIDDTVAMSDAEGPSRLCNAAFQLVQLLPEGTKQQLNKELLERYSQLGG